VTEQEDLKALFKVLIALDYPNARELEPKDSFLMWQLRYGILEDEALDRHCKDLADALETVLKMKPSERDAICDRLFKLVA
jgi:hypothetical protein